jgi:hypothetical protein
VSWVWVEGEGEAGLSERGGLSLGELVREGAEVMIMVVYAKEVRCAGGGGGEKSLAIVKM